MVKCEMHESEVIFEESIANNNMCLVKEYFFFPFKYIKFARIHNTHTHTVGNQRKREIN